MKRGDARELALHLIYGRGFTGEEPQQVVSARLDKEYYAQLGAENDIYADRPNPGQIRYLDTIVEGVANREEELNAVIQRYSIGWDVSRISRLTRCILQLAIYEIRYVDDVPTGVAISEAVRLSKKYDSSETGSFVNGILGSFARKMNEPETEEAPVEEQEAPAGEIAEAAPEFAPAAEEFAPADDGEGAEGGDE